MSADSISYKGPFRDWDAARAASLGYDAPAILEKAKRALIEVRDGRAIFERDTMLLDRIEYSYPVLAALLQAALEGSGELGVLDFGGSLGSSYYQCRSRFAPLRRLRWCVVEQPHFVACGRENFQSDELRFYASVRECFAAERIDLVLLSGVLQYLPDPFAAAGELAATDANRIVLDRTHVLSSGTSRIHVEEVPPSIYAASYPCRFFSREELLRPFLGRYRIDDEFASVIDAPFAIGDLRVEFRGYVLTRRT